MWHSINAWNTIVPSPWWWWRYLFYLEQDWAAVFPLKFISDWKMFFVNPFYAFLWCSAFQKPGLSMDTFQNTQRVLAFISAVKIRQYTAQWLIGNLKLCYFKFICVHCAHRDKQIEREFKRIRESLKPNTKRNVTLNACSTCSR